MVATRAPVSRDRPRPVRVVAAAAIIGLVLTALVVSLAGWAGSHPVSQPTGGESPKGTAPTGIAGSAVVASADGTSIPMRELQVYLDRERSAVLAQYATGGESTDERFWTTPVAGATPGARIVDAALADAVRTSVTLQLASEHGLVASADYAQFISALTTENTRRRLAVDQHQPIYGPKQYTESGYLDYLLGQYEYALGPVLAAEGTIAVTDQDIAAFAAAHPEIQGATGQSRLTQLRQLYLAEQVKQVIDQRAARVKVIRTDAVPALSRSACLVSGACTS
ncbi:MAG: hypothetical protein ABI130_01725 [Leifsonia sp.]